MTTRAQRTRRPPGSRLDELVDAAASVLAERGYRRCQMADVARAAGVSPGLLYTYVEGKEALLDLVLRRTLGDSASPAPQLPHRSGGLAETVAWLRRRLDFASDFRALEAALAAPRAAEMRAEAAAVVVEVQDVLAGLEPAISVLERCAEDLPAIGEAFLAVRAGLFARVERWVVARSRAGQLRPLADPAATARLLVEAAHWAARRRGADPGGLVVDAAAARAALGELAVHALVPDGPARDRQEDR